MINGSKERILVEGWLQATSYCLIHQAPDIQ